MTKATRPTYARVHTVGFELEGGWTHDEECDSYQGEYCDCDARRSGWGGDWHDDGSVDYFGDEVVSGEKVSPVFHLQYDPAFPFVLPSMQNWLCDSPWRGSRISAHRWAMEHWPEYVNRSCGMHVHVSFEPEHVETVYQTVLQKEFVEFICERSYAWLERRYPTAEAIRRRASREVHPYCNAVGEYTADLLKYKGRLFSPESQMETGDNRYAPVNYPWGSHQTVELRFPGIFEDPSDGMQYIRKVVSLVNFWIGVHWADEWEHTAVEIDDMNSTDHMERCLYLRLPDTTRRRELRNRSGYVNWRAGFDFSAFSPVPGEED